jgi:phage terminase large subunit-like protein
MLQEPRSFRSLLKGKSSAQIAAAIRALPDNQALALMYDWHGIWAREKQLPPEGDWRTWLINAGRGFGKTRVGSEEARAASERFPILHLAGPTSSDVRDIMVEGESGILAVSPNWNRPRYEPSKRRLTWPNGSRALLFSADEPDRFRGPQCYWAWCDELAAWRYPDSWDQLQFGLRLGTHPQCVVTTTPRPTPLIRELIADPTTVITRGSTFDNAANLAPAFLEKVKAKYEGTRLGRQELYAELLDDTPGALWNWAMLTPIQVPSAPALRRIVVAVDPAVTSNASSDQTGLVVVGVSGPQVGFPDGLLYVLEDASGIYTPLQWAEHAARLYKKYNADKVIAEVNNGGDLVEVNMRQVDRTISYKGVYAAKGKYTRAEPVSALYEQARVRHLPGLNDLETQMTTWSAGTGEKSPDRIDALVWGITELALTESPKQRWAA